jgi:hypothetical protein
VQEYERLPHLTLTSYDQDYDPYNPSFAAQEDALTKYLLETGDRIGAPPPSCCLCSVSKLSLFAFDFGCKGADISLQQTTTTLDDRSFCRSLAAQRPTPAGRQLDPKLLAIIWGIDLQTARRTVGVTTQRGVHTVLHPSLSQQFRTNDRQLLYLRLPIDCFTDTLISNTASRRNNKYAQIFATADGWCRAYPMAKKSLAHEGLSLLLFQREGVPNAMIWTMPVSK